MFNLFGISLCNTKHVPNLVSFNVLLDFGIVVNGLRFHISLPYHGLMAFQ